MPTEWLAIAGFRIDRPLETDFIDITSHQFSGLSVCWDRGDNAIIGIVKLVARFGSAPEAHIFQALLVSEDIDSEVEGESSLVYLPGSGALNDIRVFVEESDWPRARELHAGWQKDRREEAAKAEAADAALEKPQEVVSFRMVVVAYCIVAAGLAILNSRNAGALSEGQWQAKFGPGASRGGEVWSLSHDGYPGYLVCSFAAALMLFFFNRFGRPLLWITIGWWVLASVFRIGGERLIVSWPLEVVGFAAAVGLAISMHSPRVDVWFHPMLRRQSGAAAPSEDPPPLPPPPEQPEASTGPSDPPDR